MKKKNCFVHLLKSSKKGVGFGVGSGSICQRYAQNVTDPQHWFEVNNSYLLGSSQKTALAPLALALFTASFTQS
jgi:hypothetical protein